MEIGDIVFYCSRKGAPWEVTILAVTGDLFAVQRTDTKRKFPALRHQLKVTAGECAIAEKIALFAGDRVLVGTQQNGEGPYWPARVVKVLADGDKVSVKLDGFGRAQTIDYLWISEKLTT